MYRVKKVDSAINYLAKGVHDVPKNHGSCFWGVCGDEKPYLAEKRTQVVSGKEAAQLRRIMDCGRLSRARRHRHHSWRALAIRRARRRRSDAHSFTYLGPLDVERILPHLYTSLDSG